MNSKFKLPIWITNYRNFEQNFMLEKSMSPSGTEWISTCYSYQHGRNGYGITNQVCKRISIHFCVRQNLLHVTRIIFLHLKQISPNTKVIKIRRYPCQFDSKIPWQSFQPNWWTEIKITKCQFGAIENRIRQVRDRNVTQVPSKTTSSWTRHKSWKIVPDTSE